MREFFHGWRGKTGCVLVMAAALAFIAFAENPPKAALPITADDIHEFRSNYSGVTMDYFYTLKARITDEEFREYVTRLKLSPLKDADNARRERYNWGSYNANGRNTWWNPTESMVGAYHDSRANGSLIVLAKYENGYLYFTLQGKLRILTNERLANHLLWNRASA